MSNSLPIMTWSLVMWTSDDHKLILYKWDCAPVFIHAIDEWQMRGTYNVGPPW